VLLTPSNLAALQTTVRKTYQSAYRDSPDFADKMATMMPSSSATNTYAWMKRLPQLREWFGSRVIENVELHNYTLTNRKFELTVGCPTTDVKDDQLGLFSAKVEMMGRSARYLKTGLHPRGALGRHHGHYVRRAGVLQREPRPQPRRKPVQPGILGVDGRQLQHDARHHAVLHRRGRPTARGQPQPLGDSASVGKDGS
jgi:hypothetical protein